MFNKERILKTMEKYDLDALVAAQKDNIVYVSGIRSDGFAVFPRDGEPTLIIRATNSCLIAESPSWVKDVRCYKEYYVQEPVEIKNVPEPERIWSKIVNDPARFNDSLSILTDVISEKNLGNKNIGIDEKGLDASLLEKIKARFRGNFQNASSLFDDIRAVKTDEEIRDIKTAVLITEKGLDAAEAAIAEGDTEKDVALAYREVMIKEELTEDWGYKLYWGIFGCGPRSAYPQSTPTDRKIKRGDIVMLHAGCTYNNHISDICRVAICREASDKQRKYWKALFEGENIMAETIQAGVKTSELFDLAVKTVREKGIKHFKRNHTGHNLEPHSFEIASRDHTVLEENMVICLETPYYEIGWGGMNCEDEVVVKSDGCEFLSTQTRELRIA